MTVASGALRIEGLVEFQQSLRGLENGSQKQIRLVLNKAAEFVVVRARELAPVRTGLLQKSIRATSTQRTATVSEGGARVPYAGFIDYGGHVGIKRSVSRPFIKTGRILYPAYRANIARIETSMVEGLVRLGAENGITVFHG